MKIQCIVLFLFFSLSITNAQSHWQQGVSYTMDIDMDAENHQYRAYQKAFYVNNSPDTLKRFYYHLYFNAFQPGSMMDVRSLTIADPDPRVNDRIVRLEDEEIGYIKVHSLLYNGDEIKYNEEGTILEVLLADPILPRSTAVFEMEYEAQVPLQIRRSGRDNAEGIDYSMAQWYPKICQYDKQGWHANPYIGREFYGIWGNFDVRIAIDNAYMVGATGALRSKKEMDGKTEWHFSAANVIDFVWAADPDYKRTEIYANDNTLLQFYYQPGEKTSDNWEALPGIMVKAFDIIEARFGQYPYDRYSFIQAGDGGMEYSMATLITGERSIGSLVGVSVHELMHSWYQHGLATNEALYAWMDEGFTTYATTYVMNELRKIQAIPGEYKENPFVGNVNGYRRLALGGLEEPLSTHSDHFVTNTAYGSGSYTKGCVFLIQLSYILGEQIFNKALIDYYDQWKFKHPTDIDCLRVFEKASQVELDWFREYFVLTTKTIDYSIDTVTTENNETTVKLKRLGQMPMPIDIRVTYTDNSSEDFTIPMRIMRWAKEKDGAIEFEKLVDWPWTYPSYSFDIPLNGRTVSKVEIDPSLRLADVDLSNNIWKSE